MVDRGHSPMGAHVRRYFLVNCCAIITTSKWWEDLKELPAGDQKWLRADMIVLVVVQPLWEQPCELDSCEQAFSALQI